MKLFRVVLACAPLAGCAAGAPESQGQQADDAACIAQADAVYNANTVDEQARIAQPGLLYNATPTQVFDAERLGAQHVRDSQIANCEQNGNNSTPGGTGGAAIMTPQIVGSP